MKKHHVLWGVAVLIGASALILYSVNAKNADKSSKSNPKDCVTIQDGTLTTSDGEPLELGFSHWGYNYQSYLFNGSYCDYHPYYRPGGAGFEWCQQNYGDVRLVMKWNDSWLSNLDCDGDGLLDRHLGKTTYVGSGAWTTNHMSGAYEQDGKECKWNYFVKIVAVPADAEKIGGVWYTANDVEIGPDIWGSFAIIQEVNNDPCAGYNGIQTLSPTAPGFGKYK